MKDLKTQIFDIIAAARTGNKTVNDATNEILLLINKSTNQTNERFKNTKYYTISLRNV